MSGGKVKMCNYECAVKFLHAMRSQKEDVFLTCTYLNTVRNKIGSSN